MKLDKTILSKKFWKKFIAVFTDQPLSVKVENHFEEMLILAEDMYVHVTSVIIDPEVHTLEHIRETFFLTDTRINQLEDIIRRDVLVLLSISASRSKDVTNNLLLLNQVKDAERLGDYTKNIFEVFEYGAEFLTGKYFSIFDEIRIHTIMLFSEVRNSISKMDAKLAKKSCDQATKHIAKCNVVINEMMADPNCIENPVAIALLFRYQKRMLNHLRKIATAQFAPFDKFGTCGKID